MSLMYGKEKDDNDLGTYSSISSPLTLNVDHLSPQNTYLTPASLPSSQSFLKNLLKLVLSASLTAANITASTALTRSMSHRTSSVPTLSSSTLVVGARWPVSPVSYFVKVRQRHSCVMS